MAQTHEAIASKVKEIYGLVLNSKTPISILGMQSTILMASDEWTPDEVEKVSSEVLKLLISRGWNRG